MGRGTICAGENCLSSEEAETYEATAGSDNGQNFEIVDLPGILCFLTEKLSMGITPSEDQLSGCTISCPLHENCVLMASGMNLGGGTIRCKARCIDGGSLGFRGSEAFTAHWGR